MPKNASSAKGTTPSSMHVSTQHGMQASAFPTIFLQQKIHRVPLASALGKDMVPSFMHASTPYASIKRVSAYLHPNHIHSTKTAVLQKPQRNLVVEQHMTCYYTCHWLWRHCCTADHVFLDHVHMLWSNNAGLTSAPQAQSPQICCKHTPVGEVATLGSN